MIEIAFGWGFSVDNKNQLVCYRRSHVDIIIPGSQWSDFAATADMGSNRNFLICDNCWYDKVFIRWLSAKAVAGSWFFNHGTFPYDPACFFLTQIIPIPWNVPFLLKLQYLWSTLLGTHCLNPLAVSLWFSTSLLLSSMADCLNLYSLSGVIENPSLEKCWISCLHPVDLSILTATPNHIGAVTLLGLVACMIQWLRLNWFWLDGTNNAVTFFNNSGTNFFPSAISHTIFVFNHFVNGIYFTFCHIFKSVTNVL